MKEPVRGHLAPRAASVLMKLLYGGADCSLRFVAASESLGTKRAQVV